jgi:hypothetical protein
VFTQKDEALVLAQFGGNDLQFCVVHVQQLLLYFYAMMLEFESTHLVFSSPFQKRVIPFEST